MKQTDTGIVIVGGGPIGLALALDLARRGTRSVLLEQDPGTALVLLAKAGTLNARSMEFCRRWGIADRVKNWGAPPDHNRDTLYCTSLTGYAVGRDGGPLGRDHAELDSSPAALQKCPQFVLDPILAEAVEDAGKTDLRYSTRLESVAQDERGVTARIRHVDSGAEDEIRASYLVACDGSASAVRRSLGIAFDGPTLDYSVSIMLRIDDLPRYHGFGQVERFLFMGREGTWANMTSVNHKDLWRFTLVGAEERLDPAHLDINAQLKRAFGSADVPYEVLRVVPWRRSQCTARQYRVGRVLLAGDAAHTTSPTGGHGLNTGFGDVIALGWMLNAVEAGWGGPALLDAYEAERRPVAIRNSAASTRNYRAWVRSDGDYALIDTEGPEGDAARRRIGEQTSTMLYPEWNSIGVGLGYRYEGSPIIVPDGTPEPPDEVSTYEQTSRPGHRAPHAWLHDGHSTIDLFGRGFTLLRLGADAPDAESVKAAAVVRGVPLRVLHVSEPEVIRRYERRLVLVRPDDHVAWRGDSLPADPAAVLDIVTGWGQRATVPAERETAEARPMTIAVAASPIRLSHVAYRTNRLREMNDWYSALLNARAVFANNKMAVLTYDDEHHRIALVAVEPYAEKPEGEVTAGFYHVAFTYAGLDELLGTYERLKPLGIAPYRTINHGPTLSFYYRDPDRNDVELQVDAFPDVASAEAWMRGPLFAANPIGVACDPDDLIARRRAGASDQELLKRADR